MGKIRNLSKLRARKATAAEMAARPEAVRARLAAAALKRAVRKEFIHGSEEERLRRLTAVRTAYLEGGRIVNLCAEHRVPYDLGRAYCKRPTIKEQVLSRVRNRADVWKFAAQIYAMHVAGHSGEYIAEAFLCKERQVGACLKRYKRLNPDLTVKTLTDQKASLVGKSFSAMDKALALRDVGVPVKGKLPPTQNEITTAVLGAAKIGMAIAKETRVLAPKGGGEVPLTKPQIVNVIANLTDKQLQEALRSMTGGQPEPKQIEAAVEVVEP